MKTPGWLKKNAVICIVAICLATSFFGKSVSYGLLLYSHTSMKTRSAWRTVIMALVCFILDRLTLLFVFGGWPPSVFPSVQGLITRSLVVIVLLYFPVFGLGITVAQERNDKLNSFHLITARWFAVIGLYTIWYILAAGVFTALAVSTLIIAPKKLLFCGCYNSFSFLMLWCISHRVLISLRAVSGLHHPG